MSAERQDLTAIQKYASICAVSIATGKEPNSKILSEIFKLGLQIGDDKANEIEADLREYYAVTINDFFRIETSDVKEGLLEEYGSTPFMTIWRTTLTELLNYQYLASDSYGKEPTEAMLQLRKKYQVHGATEAIDAHIQREKEEEKNAVSAIHTDLTSQDFANQQYPFTRHPSDDDMVRGYSSSDLSTQRGGSQDDLSVDYNLTSGANQPISAERLAEARRHLLLLKVGARRLEPIQRPAPAAPQIVISPPEEKQRTKRRFHGQLEPLQDRPSPHAAASASVPHTKPKKERPGKLAPIQQKTGNKGSKSAGAEPDFFEERDSGAQMSPWGPYRRPPHSIDNAHALALRAPDSGKIFPTDPHSPVFVEEDAYSGLRSSPNSAKWDPNNKGSTWAQRYSKGGSGKGDESPGGSPL